MPIKIFRKNGRKQSFLANFFNKFARKFPCNMGISSSGAIVDSGSWCWRRRGKKRKRKRRRKRRGGRWGKRERWGCGDDKLSSGGNDNSGGGRGGGGEVEEENRAGRIRWRKKIRGGERRRPNCGMYWRILLITKTVNNYRHIFTNGYVLTYLRLSIINNRFYNLLVKFIDDYFNIELFYRWKSIDKLKLLMNFC